MATLADVAKLAGVSTATASRALNDSVLVHGDTKERVKTAAAQLGYTMTSRAGTTSVGEEKLIVVLPSARLTELEEAIYRSAFSSGCGVVFLPEPFNDDAVPLWRRTLKLIEKQVLGVLIVGNPVWRVPGNIKEILAPFPCVQLLDESPIPAGFFVGNDDAQIGYDAAVHLIHCGCRKIAVVSAKEDHIYAQKRTRGFITAMLEQTGNFDPGLHYQIDLASEQSHKEDFMHQIAQSGCPDGIFLVSDVITITLAPVLSEDPRLAGAQLVCVGQNERSVAGMPNVSFIDQDLFTIGEEAVYALLNRAGDVQGAKRRMLIPHRF